MKCFKCDKEITNGGKYSYVFQGKAVEFTVDFGHIQYCNECNQKRISKILKKEKKFFLCFLEVKRGKLRVNWKKYFNSPLYRSVLRNSTEGAWDIYYSLTDLLQSIGILSPNKKGNYSFENDAYHFRSYGGNDLFFRDQKEAMDYLIFLGTESPTKRPVETEIYYISKKITKSDIIKYYEKMK